MLTSEHSAMETPKDAHPDISDIYSIKHFRNSIRVSSHQSRAVTVSSGFGQFLQTLEAFAPLGQPTLKRDTMLSLMDDETGRTIRFPASDIMDAAALISTFAIDGEAPEPSDVPSPLPNSLFENNEPPKGVVPGWIAANPDLKPTLVIDDGQIVLNLTSLRMNAKSRYAVEHKCEGGTGEYWGYEVTAKGKAFGWVVLLDPGTVLVTGVEGQKHSKHRTVMSAMFRLSTYLEALDDA